MYTSIFVKNLEKYDWPGHRWFLQSQICRKYAQKLQKMPHNCQTGLPFLNLIIYPKRSWEISEGRKNVVFLELKKIVPGRVWPRTKDWEVSPASNFPPQIVLTLDVLLILKVWEVFLPVEHTMGHFEGFFRGDQKSREPLKKSWEMPDCMFCPRQQKLTHFKKQRYSVFYVPRYMIYIQCIYIYIYIYARCG